MNEDRNKRGIKNHKILMTVAIWGQRKNLRDS